MSSTVRDDLRTKDYRLGIFHGTHTANETRIEARIQRKLFSNQLLKIVRPKAGPQIVRLFGYEITVQNRPVKRVDFLGYDENHNLYVIELKKGDSSEQMRKVIAQINEYEEIVKEIRKDLEREFREVFLITIQFKEIKKMILAPRKFYNTTRMDELDDQTIEYLFFAHDDIPAMKSNSPVGVHLAKQLKVR